LIEAHGLATAVAGDVSREQKAGKLVKPVRAPYAMALLLPPSHSSSKFS
jgi:hypothetical protein